MIVVILQEPIISLPILTADNLSGNTIQITTANNESEIIKIRVPNAITNPEIAQHTNNSSNNVPQIDNNTQPKVVETEKPFKRLPVNKPANVFAAKSANIISKAATNVANSEVKSQLYENDVKVSFVSNVYAHCLSFDYSYFALSVFEEFFIFHLSEYGIFV